MKTNPKVVSFERSAAYVHHRAMKNRRDNNLVDALELMRHAVEQSPENDDYLLDLAELYCEMGCHAQSMRILLDRLSRPNAPSECYYGLALNQLGMNELASARRALRMYQMRNGDSEYMEDAINLENEIDFFEDFNRTCDRRRLRAIRIAGKACQSVREDRPDRAVRLFERSLSLDSDQAEMRAMYAVALKLAGDREGALKNAQMCLDGDASVRALCTAAQAFNMCGMADRAAEIIRRAAELNCDESEFQLLMLMMGELRMDRDAAEKLRLYLQAFPHSRVLLHMRAVALHRCGAPDAQAAAFWKRILRIDPDDTVAQFYADAAAAGTLAQNEPEYTYEVPDTEYRRRLSVIAQALAAGTDGIAERWRQDRAFRNTLIWAVSTGNVSCCRAAMILIASAGDAAARHGNRRAASARCGCAGWAFARGGFAAGGNAGGRTAAGAAGCGHSGSGIRCFRRSGGFADVARVPRTRARMERCADLHGGSRGRAGMELSDAAWKISEPGRAGGAVRMQDTPADLLRAANGIGAFGF